MPGDFGGVEGVGFPGRFETAEVLAAHGPDLLIHRVLFEKPKKKNVIRYSERVVLPYTTGDGEYTAEIEWTIRFKRLRPLPPWAR